MRRSLSTQALITNSTYAKKFHGTQSGVATFGRNAPAKGGASMLSWAIAFLVIAIIAGIFGFGGMALESAKTAQMLFFLFLLLFVIAAVLGHVLRNRHGPGR